MWFYQYSYRLGNAHDGHEYDTEVKKAVRAVDQSFYSTITLPRVFKREYCDNMANDHAPKPNVISKR